MKRTNMPNHSRVLITGGTGFIGRFLVNALIDKGTFDLILFGRIPSKNLWSSSDKVNFIKGDLCVFSDLSKLDQYGPFDFVFHCAALKEVKNQQDYQQNVAMTAHLVRYFKEKETLKNRFFLISSLAAYGPKKNNALISEDDPYSAISLYGKSKAESNRMVEQSGLVFTIFAPTAVYGQYGDDFELLFNLAKRRIRLYFRKEKQALSFIHVIDLVKILVSSLDKKNLQNKYLISDGKYYDQYAFYEMVEKVLNRTTIKVFLNPKKLRLIVGRLQRIKVINDQLSHFAFEKLPEITADSWACDISRLKNDFSFSPDYNLENGLIETLIR